MLLKLRIWIQGGQLAMLSYISDSFSLRIMNFSGENHLIQYYIESQDISTYFDNFNTIIL